jgi:hypothetical protein
MTPLRGMIRSMMIRIAVEGMVVAVTSVLVGGCGGNKSTSATISRARAVRYANAVNLRAGDFPRSTTYGKRELTAATPLGIAVARCGGGLPGLEQGSLHSEELATSHETVVSAIRVAPSAKVAAQRLAANRTARFRACIARAYTGVQTSRGSLVHERVSASALPVELPGAQRSFGLRVTEYISYAEASPRPDVCSSRRRSAPPSLRCQEERLLHIRGGRGFSSDVLGFASGRVEIALTDLHYSSVAADESERRLLSLLYRRVKAHEL